MVRSRTPTHRPTAFLHQLRTVTLSGVMVVASATGCRGITDQQLPDGVENPSMYNNREGARRLTQAVTGELSDAIRDYVIVSGLVADELNNMAAGSLEWADQRRSHDPGPRGTTGPYETLQEVRSLARLARGIVTKYVSGETSSWQATLFLYEAYAEILLADGWCSGVPLSTMDFEADWTYRAGSPTPEIYDHAIVLLDSAYTRAADSLPLQSAVRILQARAFVALARYSDAKAAVQGIGTEQQSTLRISFQEKPAIGQSTPLYAHLFSTRATVSDREGLNGLPYLSVRDPRTFVDSIRVPARSGVPSHLVWFPRKYVAPDSTSFVFASGIEARLIEAEALLHEDNPGGFLAALNTLRTTGLYSEIDTVFEGPVIVRVDTAWVAGSGGVPGLRPLVDPGSVAGRRNLLFAERAAWLFVAGSRQGDLRRLVRTYGHDRESVYPTGDYMGASETGSYGTDISFRIPREESRNPLFKGCLSDD